MVENRNFVKLNNFFFSVSVLFNMLKMTKITFLQLFFAIFDILFIYILLFAFALASRQRLALCVFFIIVIIVGFVLKFGPLLLPKSLSDHVQNVPHDWPYVRIVRNCFCWKSLKRIKQKASQVTIFSTSQYFLNNGPIHSLFVLLHSWNSGQ